MDISLITAAATAIATAKQLGQAALGVRDFNQVAVTIAEMNGQLLKAQESLFAHNTQLLELQNKHFETTQELRKLSETLAQRGRYTLFEISDRVYVYRPNLTPEGREVGSPAAAEPLHYVCQPCFENGVKSVLQKHSLYGAISLECTLCKSRFNTGQNEPFGD